MEPLFRVRLSEAGRFVIPAAIRERLGLEAGAEIVVSADDGGIRLRPLDLAIRQAQDYFASLGQPGSLASEDLIRDRRLYATHEDE